MQIPKQLNGQDLTPKEQRLLRTLDIFPDDYKETIKNPMSGESCEVNNYQEALYSFIKGCEASPWWNNVPHYTSAQKKLVTHFETALHLFGKCWGKEYMTLLD